VLALTTLNTALSATGIMRTSIDSGYISAGCLGVALVFLGGYLYANASTTSTARYYSGLIVLYGAVVFLLVAGNIWLNFR